MKRDFVGQKIRSLRKDRAMTQSELAARIGILQSDLCRMEKGEYRVGLDTLFKILAVFGMNIGEFFGERTSQEAASDELDELVTRFERLSQERRAEVLDYLRFKAEQDRRDADESERASSGD